MEQKQSGSLIRIIIIAVVAAVAGAVIGAIALYVMDNRSGNAPLAGIKADSSECAAASALAKRVGEAAAGDIAAMRGADRAISLSGLRFNDPDGKPVTLGSMRGKVLLVNLWATWCAPCREEMPALAKLQSRKGGPDFSVVAINIDTGGDEKPKAFLEQIGVENLAYYRDASMGVFNDLKAQGLAFGLPVTLLVGRDGCLLAAMNGPADWGGSDAARLIEAALAGP